jgi:hypothetical protein
LKESSGNGRKEKPGARIARDFLGFPTAGIPAHLNLQRKQEYSELRQPRRKPQPIDLKTENLVLESYYTQKLGPNHLEKKIEEIHGFHLMSHQT